MRSRMGEERRTGGGARVLWTRGGGVECVWTPRPTIRGCRLPLPGRLQAGAAACSGFYLHRWWWLVEQLSAITAEHRKPLVIVHDRIMLWTVRTPLSSESALCAKRTLDPTSFRLQSKPDRRVCAQTHS